MTLFLIVAILVLSLILVKTSEQAVVAIRRLSAHGSKAFAISAVVLAIGTSFPELSVGITSAFSGNPEVSLGDTLGSNIVNMSFIAGLAAFVVGTIKFSGSYIKKDMFAGFAAGILPLLLLLDKTLSRVDGLVLVLVYLLYAGSIFKVRFEDIAREFREETFVYKFFRRFNHINAKRKREFMRLIVSLVAMLYSADLIVKSATYLADSFSIPSFTTGLIIVAFGTSLPELAFSFKSLINREPSMFVGNLVGSTVANSTLITGLVAMLSPISVPSISKYASAIFFFVLVYLSFWFFAKTKWSLGRKESFLLVTIYIVYLAVELTKY